MFVVRTSSLLSSAWMFAYLLITYLSIYLFLYYWLWRVWNHIYTVFWDCWFFGIHTNLLYRYCFPVFLDMLSLDVLSFIMLSLVTCLISPLVMLSSNMLLLDFCLCYDINYHLPPVMLTLDQWLSHLRESCTYYHALYIVTLVLMYSCYTCTHVLLLYMYSCTLKFLNLSCSCYSHNLKLHNKSKKW